MSPALKGISTRATLVSVSLPMWSASVEDKDVTDAVLRQHGAQKGSGAFRKTLIPPTASTLRQLAAGEKQNSYHALCTFMRTVRQWHYAHTLPWGDTWFLLPVKGNAEYKDYMRVAERTFHDMLDTLVNEWDELVGSAQVQLNGLAKLWKDRWPSDIRSKFSFALEEEFMPNSGDPRVELAESEIRAIQAQTEARHRQKTEVAQKDAVQRLYDVLHNMRETLSAKGNGKGGYQKFEETLITNVRDICDTLKVLNINEDPLLETFRREAEILATGSEESTIKADVAVRTDTVNRADDILKKMTGTYGTLFPSKKKKVAA